MVPLRFLLTEESTTWWDNWHGFLSLGSTEKTIQVKALIFFYFFSSVPEFIHKWLCFC